MLNMGYSGAVASLRPNTLKKKKNKTRKKKKQSREQKKKEKKKEELSPSFLPFHSRLVFSLPPYNHSFPLPCFHYLPPHYIHVVFIYLSHRPNLACCPGGVTIKIYLSIYLSIIWLLWLYHYEQSHFCSRVASIIMEALLYVGT